MIRVRQLRARARLCASSDALSMIYLGAADNRAVVFAVIKLSCNRWHDVIGVMRKSQEKGKGDFERRNNGGSYRGRDTIGRPQHRYTRFRRRWPKDERIEANVATRLWCRACHAKHARSARPIAYSGLVRSAGQAARSDDASRCRKSIQHDERLSADSGCDLSRSELIPRVPNDRKEFYVAIQAEKKRKLDDVSITEVW